MTIEKAKEMVGVRALYKAPENFRVATIQEQTIIELSPTGAHAKMSGDWVYWTPTEALELIETLETEK